MVGVLALWMPILVAAVFVFVASSVIHMFLPYHRSDFKGVPEEDAVMDALRGFNIPAGDYVVPRAGSPEAMKSALGAVRRGGRVSLTGVNGNQEVPFVTDKIVLDEVDIYGVRSHPNTWEATIALVAAGKLDASRLVTHRLPLEKFMEGLDIFVNRKEGCIRVVMNP